ncbi:MAG: hypothetical protein H6815_01755 [Phycisphaeraceae bacterium]|nr:hypothetical protein [Phycisphaerales bacterium]MCB9859153.1 hypothetical protein [Phycisphaeraceae bacterium]
MTVTQPHRTTRAIEIFCVLSLLSGCTVRQDTASSTVAAIDTPDESLVKQSTALFERLSKLDGTFLVPTERARTTYVTFENASRGGSIVETWRRKNEPVHSITVFYRDQGVVYCRHYCPQGNQPILRLDSFDGTVAHFSLVTLTGDRDRAHMHLLTMEFPASNDHVGVEEVYFTGDEPNPSAMRVFERVNEMVFDTN